MKTIGERLDEACPIYLAMGMTYQQYWDEDCLMAIPYREAYRIRQDDQNRFAWLQGLYIYEAICDVSPILHAFAKSGTKARPYPDKPYEFNRPKKKNKAEENKQKMEHTFNFMQNLTARFHETFLKKQMAEQEKKEKEQAQEEKQEQADS